MSLQLVASLAAGLTLFFPLDNGQWWLDDIGVDRSAIDGSGVTVAVIDTGIDASHPNLSDVVLAGSDFSGVGNLNGTLPVGPSSFHGTMVASLIAGQGISPGDVLGIAPGAKLLSASIGLGVEAADTDAQLAQAIIWSVDNGADIINLSVTRNSAKWPRSWDEAFLYAFENDVVIVAATGNQEQGEYATAPAVIPGVVAVTAVDREGNPGEQAGSSGIGVTLAAPGIDLPGSIPGGGSALWSGSSAAAPIVSGVLALMLQADPVASANDLIQRLIDSATDAGEPGFDAVYGYGIVNPANALAATARATENPLGSLQNWINLYRPDVKEDAAVLLPPPAPQQLDPAPLPANSDQGSVNPLLYLLLVPLALLPLLVMRNRFGRK